MVSDIIKHIAVVGAGSFIGGAIRYLVSLLMKDIGKGFPWATLAVNLVGCFLIGFLWGVFSRTAGEGSNWALFLTVGLCGIPCFECHCRCGLGCSGLLSLPLNFRIYRSPGSSAGK